MHMLRRLFAAPSLARGPVFGRLDPRGLWRSICLAGGLRCLRSSTLGGRGLVPSAGSPGRRAVAPFSSRGECLWVARGILQAVSLLLERELRCLQHSV
ncbi:hypothetical protein NDU88_003060 [Pleurodeles waltl]|uniref:Uncharacterized protein n=1 Tax=Pleurodeles waltl TaxID=8319 RepID=A0AAV7VCZ4_PLEWA|nr:hypothetical protein NDU88_003060 [Pleurodeles waltl]